jgi:hypothetical protein
MMRDDDSRDDHTSLVALVELAAYLTMTATTDDLRQLAARKRQEAREAIMKARSQVDDLEQLLGCFPAAHHC